MKKNTFLIVLAAILSCACVAADMQQRNSMPTTLDPSNFPKLTPTPNNIFLPTTEDIDAILKDSTGKLGIVNTQVMTLAKQPAAIVASIAPFEGERYNPNNLKWAENIQIVTGERDLNHDGMAERVIVQFTDIAGSKTTPSFRLFGLRKQKWHCLTCPMLIYLSDNTEFVRVGKAGKYDTIRFRDTADDVLHLEEIFSPAELKKWTEYVTDARMVNGKYVFYECRLENQKAKKVVPCPD